MRMWCVPTDCMCRQHLLGAHVEKGQCDISKLKTRHAELVNEMNIRGYNHKSPLRWDADFIIADGIEKYGVVEIDVENNLKVLAGRCKKCKELQIKYGYYIGEV